MYATRLPVPASNEPNAVGTGLTEGTRRDPTTNYPELADLLSKNDQARWSRQNTLTAKASDAKARVDDAKRLLGRARRTDGVDLTPLEDDLRRLEKELEQIRAEPEFQNAVQRPLPIKQAAPSGTVYHHAIEVVDGTDEEVELLLAALGTSNINPRIGGGRTIGYGRIKAEYGIEVQTGEPLRRKRIWSPAGAVVIGGEEDVVQSQHCDVTRAMATWEATEAEIRGKTAIFGAGDAG